MNNSFGYNFLPLLLYSTAVISPQVGAASEQTPSATQPISLFNVELVTRLDPMVGEGGFDTSYDFDRRLMPNVGQCVDSVRKACLDWVNIKKFTVLQLEVEKNHEPLQFHLQFTGDKVAGIFEVTYRVSPNEGRAQGSYWFYDTTGDRLAVGVRHNLDPYRGLGNLLLEAMQCGN